MWETMLHLPVWLLALCLLLMMSAAWCVGRQVRACAGRRQTHASDDSFLLASILGLLALSIGFVLVLALHRYDERGELVVREASAIDAVWNHADRLEASERAAWRTLLRSYVDARLAYSRAPTPMEEEAGIQRTGELQQKIWSRVQTVLHDFRVAPALTEATAYMFQVASAREVSRKARLPTTLLATLLAFCLLAAMLMGFRRGHQPIASALAVLLIVLSVSCVADLDRPASGSILVSQQAMLEVQRALRVW